MPISAVARPLKQPPIGVDDVRIRRVDALGGIELVNARFLNRRSAPHSHTELEIGLVTAGTRKVHCRGKVFYAKEGSILAFAPGEVHAGLPDDTRGSEYCAFLIPQERLAGWTLSPDEAGIFDSPVIDDPSLARRLLRTHARLSRPGGETDRSQDGQLLLTFEALQRWHRRAPDESERDTRQAVAIVREHLHHHYAERIRLESLARLAGLSVFHLIRIFRDDTGLTPYAYLGQVRVHRAAQMLREGMPVSMVASATGFADQSHLTRLFKRLVGVPPGEYQRAGRSKASCRVLRSLRANARSFMSRGDAAFAELHFFGSPRLRVRPGLRRDFNALRNL